MRRIRPAVVTGPVAASAALLLSGCVQVHSSMDDIPPSVFAERADDLARVTAVRDDCAPDAGISADSFSVQVIEGDAAQGEVVRCIAAALETPELERALVDGDPSGRTSVLHRAAIEWTTQGRVFTATVSVGAFS